MGDFFFVRVGQQCCFWQCLLFIPLLESYVRCILMRFGSIFFTGGGVS